MDDQANGIVTDLMHPKGGEDLRPKGSKSLWRAIIDDAVTQQRHSRAITHKIRHEGWIRPLALAKVAAQVVDQLTTVRFPSSYGDPNLNPGAINASVDYTLVANMGNSSEQALRDVSGASAAKVARRPRRMGGKN